MIIENFKTRKEALGVVKVRALSGNSKPYVYQDQLVKLIDTELSTLMDWAEEYQLDTINDIGRKINVLRKLAVAYDEVLLANSAKQFFSIEYKELLYEVIWMVRILQTWSKIV